MHPTPGNIMRRGSLQLSSTLLALLFAAAVHAQCPTAVWYSDFLGLTTQSFTGPTLDADQLRFGNPCLFCPATLVLVGRVHADFTNGVTRTEALVGSCIGEVAGQSSAGVGDLGLNLDDEFQLIGPTSTTPIALTAVYHVTGSISASESALPGQFPFCSSSIIKFVYGDVNSPGTRIWGDVPDCTVLGPRPVGEDLRVPLSRLPGQTFRLAHRTFARGHCTGFGGVTANITSQLLFELPSGYTITSCNGYTAAVTTPTRRTSWGALKTHYR